MQRPEHVAVECCLLGLQVKDMCVCVSVCDKKLQIHLSSVQGLFFFPRAKRCLVLLLAAASAEAVVLLPAAAGTFAAGHSDLIFFSWIAKSSLELWASFHRFRCRPSGTEERGCAACCSCGYSCAAWVDVVAGLSSIFPRGRDPPWLQESLSLQPGLPRRRVCGPKTRL